ncbi:alpha/beta hydrolase [bacterium]|nr:alpha/beta hydrolase [bacterium]
MKSKKQNSSSPSSTLATAEKSTVKLNLLKALFDELRLPFHMAYLGFKWSALLKFRQGKSQLIYVIPGYLTSDRSTHILRHFLLAHGYDVHGWGLGTNNKSVVSLLPQITEKLKTLTNQKKKKVILIGWSLGGYLAREVARDNPQIIDRVITMGTPNRGGPKMTAYEEKNKKGPEEEKRIEKIIAEREKTPITVPLYSIYSKSDKTVWWEASVDNDKRHQVIHHEVHASHGGLGFHPDVYQLILKCLS